MWHTESQHSRDSEQVHLSVRPAHTKSQISQAHRYSETLPQKNLTDLNFSNLSSVLNVKLQPDALPMKGQARWPIKREGCVLSVLRQQVPKQTSKHTKCSKNQLYFVATLFLDQQVTNLPNNHLFPNDNSHSQRPTLRRQTRSFFLLLIHKAGIEYVCLDLGS